MRKYNVLVTGTSSYGVGEGLLKVINNSKYKENIRLIGASNSNLTAFKHLVENYYILPDANDNDYLTKLKDLLIKEGVDILIPGSEAEMKILSMNKKGFAEIVDLWVNDYELINTFDNKSIAERYFRLNQLNVPKSYKKISDIKIEYPVIIKPIHGKSSEGIYIINNETQLKAVMNLYDSYNREYIIQQYLEDGLEYTVSMVNLNEIEPEIFISKRILNKGATQYAFYEENDEIKSLCFKLDSLLNNYLLLNIQLIRKKNNYYILEVNPRFSGSSPMRSLMGFNEFDIIFSKKYLGLNLDYKIPVKASCIRGYIEF